MTQIDDKALEAAVLAHDKEEAAMRGEPDPWADERPEDEFADRKAAMAEAIRAYLTAVSTDVSGLVVSTMDRIIQECETERWFLGTVNAREVIRKHIARSLTDLEAENARLKAEVERLRELASELPIVKYALRATEARLAEALKALEPFALVAEHDISEDETDSDAFRPMPKPFNHAPQITVGHLRAARRVLEGSK